MLYLLRLRLRLRLRGDLHEENPSVKNNFRCIDQTYILLLLHWALTSTAPQVSLSKRENKFHFLPEKTF